MSKKQRTFPSTTSGFSPQFGLFFSLCPVGESQYKFTGQGLPRRKNERDRGTILGKRKRVDGAPQVRIHAKPLKISSFESAHVPMSQRVVFFILWLGGGSGGGKDREQVVKCSSWIPTPDLPDFKRSILGYF